MDLKRESSDNITKILIAILLLITKRQRSERKLNENKFRATLKTTTYSCSSTLSRNRSQMLSSDFFSG